MFNLRRLSVLVTAVMVAYGAIIAGSPQRPAAGPYTSQQSEAGRAAYQANCAGCHRADLAGSNEAPQLAGSNFMNVWGSRTSRDLFTYIQASMPPGNRIGLGDQIYIDIVAFLL